MTFTLLPVSAAFLLFAREGLGLWFGNEFATTSFRFTQILTIGAFINCLAFSPFYYLQGVGRPDITAKTHLIEVPLYLLLLWILIGRWSVIGVAVAWTFRMVLDLTILSIAASRQAPVMRDIVGRAAPRFVWPILVLFLLLLIQPLAMKGVAFLVVSALSGWIIWNEWRSGHIALDEPQAQLT